MGRLRARFAPAVFALALAACVPSPSPGEGPTTPEAPESGPVTAPDGAGRGGYARDMSSADRTACETSGGSVQRRGMIGMEMCVHPYADAGATCSDSSECEGKCVAGAGNAPDEAITGQCQADDRLFGCYAEVKAGKAAYTICVD